MKANILVGLFLILLSWQGEAEPKSLKVSFKKSYGPVVFQNNSKVKLILKKKQLVQDDLHFEVGENGQAQFMDPEGNLIVLLSNSSGAIQLFSDQGMVQLAVTQGNVRVISTGEKPWATMKTLVSSTVVADQDVGLKFDRAAARVELLSFRGKIDFRANQSDESRLIGDQQKAFFQGVIEEGSLAYDLLLHGKKVPKGILSELMTLSAEDQKIFKIESPEKERLAELKAAQKAMKVAKGICQNPVGDLNQCAWKCLGIKKGMKNCPTKKTGFSCERSRCNANGEWSDHLILSPEAGRVKCQAKPVVTVCDY